MSNTRETEFLRLQEERLTALEKKRADRKDANHSYDLIVAFQDKFNTLKAAIDADLGSLPGLGSDVEKRDKLSGVQIQAGELQTLLNESMTFLTAHEIRRAQDGVTAVHDSIARAQQQCLPRKKFAFGGGKKKKTTAPPPAPVVAPTPVAPVEGGDNRFAKYSGDVVVTDKTSDTIHISREQTTGKDVLLKNLTSCTVHIPGVLGTLHCTNCTDCTFIIGVISGSLFLERCSNSTFTVTCQQARIHTTHDATFHIHVTSKAIIEDCTGLRFGERKEGGYEGYLEDFKSSGLGDSNNWSDVDDFNWLNKEQSPNWTTI
eukprot:sb/3466926/